jgi:hypothetical protein
MLLISKKVTYNNYNDDDDNINNNKINTIIKEIYYIMSDINVFSTGNK